VIKTDEHREESRTARELLGFVDELMRATARDLGDPGAAELTLLDLRLLRTLRESRVPLRVDELARMLQASEGQAHQSVDRLRALGLAERAGGGRGTERAYAVARRGRRWLSSFERGRQRAVERFIDRLDPTERLRLEGAAHLLGHRLDRLSGGMLPSF
jgi:DNA-binding MarR family transcriptional regulator